MADLPFFTASPKNMAKNLNGEKHAVEMANFRPDLFLAFEPKVRPLTPNDLPSNDELFDHYKKLLVNYGALVETFSVLLKDQSSAKLKKVELSLVKQGLLYNANAILKTYKKLLIVPSQKKAWGDEIEKLLKLDTEEPNTIQETVENPLGISEIFLSRSKRFFEFAKKIFTQPSQVYPIETTTGGIAEINAWRSIFSYFRSALESFNPFIPAVDKWSAVLNPIGKSISILGMTLYGLRLTINLAMIIKHTFLPGEEEKDLGWFKRLKGQLLTLGPVIVNDLIWFGVGVATFFFLTGTLGSNIAIGFYLGDVINATYFGYLELKKHDKIMENIVKKLDDPTLSTEERHILEIQKQSLEHQISHETKQIALGIGVTVGLFACAVVGLSIMAALGAALPYVAAAAAVTALAIVVGEKLISKYLSKAAPPSSLPNYECKKAGPTNTFDQSSTKQNIAILQAQSQPRLVVPEKASPGKMRSILSKVQDKVIPLKPAQSFAYGGDYKPSKDTFFFSPQREEEERMLSQISLGA